MEQVLEQFREKIIAATASKTPLRIRGGGTKDWYGQSLQGEVLDTSAYTGIVAYEPTELVIVARAGTPLAEIEAALDAQNQMLAFEPPRFGAESTIGGVVAAGLSGPRRQAVGAVRDFVLGATLVDGKGDVLRFGGQVMKNVAGYDVSRLLAGSLGTLGLIVDVSLKVLPKPFMETTLRFELGQKEAIERLNNWGGQPLPVSASAWHGGTLIVRLSGAVAAVKAAVQKMGGEEDTQAADFWSELRDHGNAFLAASDGPALWRLSVPSVAPPLDLEGDQLIEWGGAQRWIRTSADAKKIRAVAEKAGGHATLFRAGETAAGVFHPLAPAVAAIHRNLKNAFDPSGIFNPGRMYKDF
ncbi:glycolate oxidase subunit GlcE [Noviherbaspirillum denitrificans]|uniref:Glycolate oxidase n=1 Tax=Noviherbaspirillum denitrificans TaxID=1968433 RepID=A0A254TEF3_9BURK|nr:glycolate oxidase subunit GlcE [Noviherbaspirillum denitrificans]OWW19702.1 glycolate oxidase [Noviherbaspirillum denitrificans]